MSINEPILITNRYVQGQNWKNLYRSGYPFFEKYLREFSATKDNKVIVVDENLAPLNGHPFNLHSKNLVLIAKPLDKIEAPDQYLGAISQKIPIGTVLLASAEISEITKQRILSKYPPLFNWVVYSFFFLLHRVVPKFSHWSNQIYTRFTKGKINVQHRAEMLGRITAHGFTVFEYAIQDGRLFMAASKTTETTGVVDGSTGLIFSMPRIGRSGKELKVYKLRTMHAYSQYLHEFMMREHGLDSDGKFRNDFRIATWGRFFRKYWIDELPMIVNLLRGEIKIVGVRPISKKYLALYPADVQRLRMQTKPGFIPPSYAFSPGSLEEIIQLEKQYLLEYLDKPLRTDIKYFFKVFRNVFISKIRSR